MTTRPKSLKGVAEQSESIGEFGQNLRDWLHKLRRLSSRPQAIAAVGEEPPQLKDKFPEGYVADAWLAAYAEHLATEIGRPCPDWALAPSRFAAAPIFDEWSESAELRAIALAQAPSAFRRRNIFTPSVDLPLRLLANDRLKERK